MQVTIMAAALALTLGVAAPGAQAAGCLKGAVVGGVAGHLAGHGVAGAAVGCAVGHHEATKAARQKQVQPNKAEDGQTQQP
jgi:uncharacterized protein YcfJ